MHLGIIQQKTSHVSSFFGKVLEKGLDGARPTISSKTSGLRTSSKGEGQQLQPSDPRVSVGWCKNAVSQYKHKAFYGVAGFPVEELKQGLGGLEPEPTTSA